MTHEQYTEADKTSEGPLYLPTLRVARTDHQRTSSPKTLSLAPLVIFAVGPVSAFLTTIMFVAALGVELALGVEFAVADQIYGNSE